MEIQLIPVIELNLSYLNDGELSVPVKDQYSNKEEWANYYRSLLLKSDFSFNDFSINGYPLLTLDEIKQQEDLQKLISKHVYGDTSQTRGEFSTCAFFGGIIVYINNEMIYKCQCCSTLAEHYGYNYLVENSQYENIPFLVEGHPCPLATREAEKIYIDCNHFPLEPYERPAKSYTISASDLEIAVQRLNSKIQSFAQKLDTLSSLYGQKVISDQLVYDHEEYKAILK